MPRGCVLVNHAIHATRISVLTTRDVDVSVANAYRSSTLRPRRVTPAIEVFAELAETHEVDVSGSVRPR